MRTTGSATELIRWSPRCEGNSTTIKSAFLSITLTMKDRWQLCVFRTAAPKHDLLPFQQHGCLTSLYSKQRVAMATAVFSIFKSFFLLLVNKLLDMERTSFHTLTVCSERSSFLLGLSALTGSHDQRRSVNTAAEK